MIDDRLENDWNYKELIEFVIMRCNTVIKSTLEDFIKDFWKKTAEEMINSDPDIMDKIIKMVEIKVEDADFAIEFKESMH